ncbi:histidine phosphatase family protein [Fibrella sp. WM1]|uniref:SixA phosphatase family protein n=1 Tax=Fibrella musci TaxID=3242485 RepID=UPI00352309AF
MKVTTHTLLALLFLLASSCTTRTYYIVRHADRVPGQDAITPAGETRTRVLADSLRNKGITHIFSTDTRRTRLTATPLSEATGVAITLYNYADPARQADVLAAFTETLRQKKTCLVVGHSNTILEIVRALGATPTVTSIGEQEFDRLFIVQRTQKWPSPGTRVRLREARYGAVAH